jgi:hypothetical protein
MTQTKNRHANGIKHFQAWKPFLQQDKTLKCLTDDMVERNFINLPTIMENAISIINGSTVVDQISCDLSDGSDAKFSSVRKRNQGKIYSANIAGFKNKTGLLRIQVYESKYDKTYWFCIPHEIYSQVNEIEIPFLLTGEPDRNKRQKHLNFCWWNYEKFSFYEMASMRSHGACEPLVHTTFNMLFEETIDDHISEDEKLKKIRLKKAAEILNSVDNAFSL